MKNVVTIVFLLWGFSLSGQTIVPGGYVQGNWTQANSPYLIQGSITVNYGQSLKINPGVEVIFQGLFPLYVYGVLVADGTAAQPVVFRAQDTTGWHNDALPSGGWRGIHYDYAPAGDSSRLNYCYIQDTKHGVMGNASIAGGLRAYRGLHVSNCKFFHNQSTQNQSNGVIINVSTFAPGQKFEMDHCEIFDNATRVAAIMTDNYTGGNMHIHHNKIYQNTGGCGLWAIWCRLLLEENEIYNNTSTIDGSAVKVSVSKDSKIFRNKIHHNTCETIGAVHCTAGKVDIDANLICNNQHTSGFCGATDGGGGIHVAHNDNGDFDSTFYIVRNNVIANNYSSLAGGGIYVYNARVKIMNNHFVRNSSAAGSAAVMRCIGNQSELEFQNNLFYGNQNFIASPACIEVFEAAYLKFAYNWMETSYTQFVSESVPTDVYGDTTNNLSGSSPGMINPTNTVSVNDDATLANFDIAGNSPCINTGNNDTTGCYVTPLDFAGNNRMVVRMDIGAYEFRYSENIENELNQKPTLGLYPNPTRDFVTMTFPESGGGVVLINAEGRSLLTKDSLPFDYTLSLKDFTRGVYFILWSKDGKQITDKFVMD